MRKSPIRPVSKRRAAQNRERRKIAQEYRDAAEGGVVLCVMCGRPARDLDEKLSRARGGSPTDRANIQPLCAICHHLKTVNPAWAEAEGWSLSAFGGEQ